VPEDRKGTDRGGNYLLDGICIPVERRRIVAIHFEDLLYGDPSHVTHPFYACRSKCISSAAIQHKLEAKRGKNSSLQIGAEFRNLFQGVGLQLHQRKDYEAFALLPNEDDFSRMVDHQERLGCSILRCKLASNRALAQFDCPFLRKLQCGRERR